MSEGPIPQELRRRWGKSEGFVEGQGEAAILGRTLEGIPTAWSAGPICAALVFCGLALGCGRLGFDPQAGDVDAIDNDSAVDAAGNGELVDGGASPFAATHNGWVNVIAVGATVPKASTSALPSTPSRVEFVWRPMTIVPETEISTYGVYRATSRTGDYEEVGDVPADVLRFQDATAQPLSTYYYQVRPLVEGFSVAAADRDATLEVKTPPDNMALVHRWIANQEVCGLLGQSATVDRTNEYRCDYTGPGRVNYNGDIGDPPASDSFYDLGAHHFVDQFEMGCDYTLQSSGCPDAAGAPGPCLGIGSAAPDALANEKNGNVQTGNDGDVFYDRGSSVCYLKNATAWVAANAGSTLDAERARLASNAPGLPPLVLIGQIDSWGVCQGHMVAGDGKQLLSRKLHVAASAWPAELTDAEIYDIEAGIGPTSCNADLGHPGETTFDALVEPADYATLPGTLGNSARVLRTGDSTNAQCRSRYGISDMAGNVWEWVSDQTMASAAGAVCTGIPSSLDSANRDFADVAITRAAGGGGGQWDLALAPQFLPVLGLPLEASPASWLQARATSEVTDQGDGMFMDSGSDGLRATYVGGSSSSNQWAGRYTINLSRAPSTFHERIGFRCAFRIEP